jgi:hypothetical protein
VDFEFDESIYGDVHEDGHLPEAAEDLIRAARGRACHGPA